MDYKNGKRTYVCYRLCTNDMYDVLVNVSIHEYIHACMYVDI